MTILAKKGNLAPDKKDNQYLKMELYDGIAYSDNIKNKNQEERLRQENQYTKFDTLNYYIDISDILNSGKDEDPGGSYKYLDGGGLRHLIDSLNGDYKKYYKELQKNTFDQNYYFAKKTKEVDSVNTKMIFDLKEYSVTDKDRILLRQYKWLIVIKRT